ncbi:MAG: glycine--tRNA ligase [archaeon]
MSKPDKYEILAELARRRGLFWPSFEIYGGVSGFIDYGPLGTSLRRKIENKWRRLFISGESLLEIDTPIIVPERVFLTSGHVDHFKDPIVQCLQCKRAFRADHLLKETTGAAAEGLSISQMIEEIANKMVRCPECGGSLSDPEEMSTMFRTAIGPAGDATAYGRPETAQGMFVDFKRLHEISRDRLPIGIAQIGRVLRNEISPRQGPIRLREFNMMEFEFFFDPQDPRCTRYDEIKDVELNLVPLARREKGLEESITVTVGEAVDQGYLVSQWLAYFMVLSKRFVSDLGIPENCQRFHEKLATERAHYSQQTYDLEVLLDRWGWVELAGHAYRGDFDLSAHMKVSGVDLRAFKPYDKPRTTSMRRVKPNLALIGKEYKEQAPQIAKLVTGLNPDEFEASIKSNGYVEVGGYRLRSEHASVVSEQIEETGHRFLPHVVEPSFGTDRLLYATVEYAYTVKEDRVVLQLPRDLVPVDIVVLPLMAKDGLREKANKIYFTLREERLDAEYDEAGSIGRRYARADEVGIPLGVTVDYGTLKDDTVTIRERDSWNQVRANSSELPSLVWEFLRGKKEFKDLGTPLTQEPRT